MVTVKRAVGLLSHCTLFETLNVNAFSIAHTRYYMTLIAEGWADSVSGGFALLLRKLAVRGASNGI